MYFIRKRSSFKFEVKNYLYIHNNIISPLNEVLGRICGVKNKNFISPKRLTLEKSPFPLNLRSRSDAYTKFPITGRDIKNYVLTTFTSKSLNCDMREMLAINGRI